MTLYGLKSFNMTGRVTASDEPHRKRVTGGIFRISSQNPVYGIARTMLFAADYNYNVRIEEDVRDRVTRPSDTSTNVRIPGPIIRPVTPANNM